MDLFNNNLIIQWGVHTSTNSGTGLNTVNLAISYTSYYSTVTTFNCNQGNLIAYERYIYSKNLSSMTLWVHTDYKGGFYWITIGT